MHNEYDMIENTITDKSLRLLSKYIHLINSNVKIILLLLIFYLF